MSEDKKEASFDEKVKWLTDRGIPKQQAIYKVHSNEMVNLWNGIFEDYEPYKQFNHFEKQRPLTEDADFEVIEPKQIENGER